MSDANPVTVDGVAPSIHIRYVENAALGDKNSRIDLFQADDGTPRSVSVGNSIWVTLREYVRMTKAFNLEVLNEPTVASNQQVVADPTLNPISKSLGTPGQTG
jgi:hypothetical protein